jgi:hypothetical protein
MGQRAQMLQRLIAEKGGKVPLPELLKISAQYNARIFELRRLGFRIDNETKVIAGVKHSWFWLVVDPAENKKESEPALSFRQIPHASGYNPQVSLFGDDTPVGTTYRE